MSVDYSESGELIEFCKTLIANDLSAFQIGKAIRKIIPGCKDNIVQKIRKLAVADMLEVAGVSSAQEKASIVTLISTQLQNPKLKIKYRLKLIDLKIKLLALLPASGDMSDDDSQEKQVRFLLAFNKFTKAASDGSAYQAFQDGKPLRDFFAEERTKQSKAKEVIEITPDEKQEIKLAAARGLKAEIRRTEREVKHQPPEPDEPDDIDIINAEIKKSNEDVQTALEIALKKDKRKTKRKE